MRSRSTHSIPHFLFLSSISFFRLTTAALSLQELQPIANFPAACQSAYQVQIQSCPDADSFSLAGLNSGPSICSKDCFIALSKATTSIQRACQGSSAPPGTVIAHAFAGDLPVWLCSLGSGSGTQPSSSGSPSPSSVPSSSSSLSATISVSSLTSVVSTANPTASSSAIGSNSVSSTNTRRSSSTDPLVSSGSDSATKTTPNIGSVTSSSSISTRSSNRASETTSRSSAQATTSSPDSTSSRTEPTLKPGGGGSPFDQVVPNTGASHDVSKILPVVLTLSAALATIFSF